MNDLAGSVHITHHTNSLTQGDQADPEAFFHGAISDYPTISDLEERYIRFVLERTGGRKEKAAAVLGIHRRTLYRKVRMYGIENSQAG